MQNNKLIEFPVNEDPRKIELDCFEKLKRLGMPNLELCQWPLERVLLVHLSIFAFEELSKEEPSRVVKRVVPQMGIGYNGELIEPVIKFDDSGELVEPPYPSPILYTTDFFVEINDYKDPELKIQIMVEIDGHEHHSSRQDRKKDSKKTIFLEKAGYKVLRFTGSQVNENPKIVLKDIVEIGKVWSGKLNSVSVPF
jgi:hypothetical protein